MKIDNALTLADLSEKIEALWALSAVKINKIEKEYDATKGSPVFTQAGSYTTRGWTEWTQGFQYGSAILQFDATGDESFLTLGRRETVEKMASHVGHFGVHDHGFNNVSTYGNLLRLMKEGRIPQNGWEEAFYQLALKLSGAVQAKRWTTIKNGGFIHSFNGPHSLFVDTIRTCRSLVVSHQLGHSLMGENDAQISLLGRTIEHIIATASYAVYYGDGRDIYDEWGRTAHESVFNTTDGNYRCPNSQQGYTGFSTWTRGLSWAITGFAEQLEFFTALPEEHIAPFIEKEKLLAILEKGAKATCDFYIKNTPTDGIPYWDTGAPNLHKLGDYLNRPSDPFNDFEPIDSSSAAIASQGFLRLAKCLENHEPTLAKKYFQAGLTMLDNLFTAPYLSEDPTHQGLILHSIYHHPNGWDYVPEGSKIPYGESSMWGDYHAREVALYVKRLIEKKPYYTFYGCVS